MTDQEAINFTTEIFDHLKKSKTILDLEIISDKFIKSENRLNIDNYPKIEFDIKADEIRSLIDSNILDKDLNFTANISSLISDPLAKILYATAWKQGDLRKIKHILKGISDYEKVDNDQNDALVFYQFGKYLTKSSGQPIIDQHAIRAFSIYCSTATEDIRAIRKLQSLNKNHKPIINKYINWLKSDNLTKELKSEKDYTYHIDKVLYGTGKSIKFLK